MSETSCKKCGGKTKVTNTYRRATIIERRRECPKCFIAFKTVQKLEAEKRDAQRA